jgi:hypothetical protein
MNGAAHRESGEVDRAPVIETDIPIPARVNGCGRTRPAEDHRGCAGERGKFVHELGDSGRQVGHGLPLIDLHLLHELLILMADVFDQIGAVGP